jgi:hypothetical protein
MDLFSQLKQSLQGGQAGQQSMQQGQMPGASQPRGSQQLWIAAIAATRSEIMNLNTLADSLRRVGEDQCDREVTACTHKLQGVLDKLKQKMSDMQENQV